MYKTDGRHLVIDFWGCKKELLDNNKKISSLLKKAARIAGSTILGEKKFKFKPYGCTVMVILKESHISCHTYPEYNFAALDIYTCGLKTSPQKALIYLKKEFKPKKIKKWFIERG